MWKFVFSSRAGISHASSGKPCQDYCKGIELQSIDHNILLGVCSDGAGSALHSDVGAKLASDRFLLEVECWMATNDHSNPPDFGTIKAWIDSARHSISDRTIDIGCSLREMACTLLAAMVADEWAVFVQIGDGAIVFDSNDDLQLAFWPSVGEYANSTYFLTDDDYEKHIQWDVLKERIRKIAMFTDGLQMLALDFNKHRPHTKFFGPLFSTVKLSTDDDKLLSDLCAYLDSDRMNERTDDDKSLLLGVRTERVSHEPEDLS